MVQRLRYFGTVKEATFDENPAPQATAHVDIASATLDAPSEPDIIYAGGLQRTAKTRRPGFYAPAGNVVYAFDIDSIGEYLRYALGGYVFTLDTPVAGLNTHEFYGDASASLPSFVSRLGKDILADDTNFEHVFSGCTLSQISIAVSDALAEATLDIQAAQDSRADIKAITDLILPSSYPLAFHELTALLNSVDRSTLIKSAEFTINNNAAVADGRSIGSRFPRRIPVGERATTFTFELFWESIAELQLFWGGNDGPIAGPNNVEFPIVMTWNSGDDGGAFAQDRTMIITFPAAWYMSAPIQPAGRDEATQTLTGQALLADQLLLDTVTTVETEVYIQLINDQADLTA